MTSWRNTIEIYPLADGPDSANEIVRLNARIGELQTEKRRLEIENSGLRSGVGLVAVEPPAGDGLDIPECLRRAAP